MILKCVKGHKIWLAVHYLCKKLWLMKSRVDLSTFSFILTIVVLVAMGAAVYATYGTDKFLIVVAAVIVLLIFCLYYAPLSISANEKEICVNSSLWMHRIPMRRVVGVERFQPTMGGLRLCGSGGFLGYWGMFKEGDIGHYTAYYGKASDCFLIRLDNGDKYILGCKNPDGMVAYIKGAMKSEQ